MLGDHTDPGRQGSFTTNAEEWNRQSEKVISEMCTLLETSEDPSLRSLLALGALRRQEVAEALDHGRDFGRERHHFRFVKHTTADTCGPRAELLRSQLEKFAASHPDEEAKGADDDAGATRIDINEEIPFAYPELKSYLSANGGMRSFRLTLDANAAALPQMMGFHVFAKATALDTPEAIMVYINNNGLADLEKAYPRLEETLFKPIINMPINNEDDAKRCLALIAELAYELNRIYPYIRGTAGITKWVLTALLKHKKSPLLLPAIDNTGIPFDQSAHFHLFKEDYIEKFVEKQLAMQARHTTTTTTDAGHKAPTGAAGGPDGALGGAGILPRDRSLPELPGGAGGVHTDTTETAAAASATTTKMATTSPPGSALAWMERLQSGRPDAPSASSGYDG